MPTQAHEIMAFVPSGPDYVRALAFYVDLGFSLDFQSEDIAIMRKDSCRFYLQNFTHKPMQRNFMMNLEVRDLNAWWAHIQAAGLAEKYPDTRFQAPATYPWGKREIHVTDPAGVLWHIAERA